MEQEVNCFVCNTAAKFYQNVNDVVVDHAILYQKYVVPAKRNMEIYRCPLCTHVQCLPTEVATDVFSETKGQAQYSGQMDMMKDKLTKLKEYAKNGDYLLDIGCGTGYAMKSAKNIFTKSLGIEPAVNTCKIAQEQGFEVINDYFSKELNLKKEFKNFSAFVSCQVFEHLTDIYSVLDYAYEVLKPGGVGLINVPNGATIIECGLFHQLVFEHVNYFTPYSIAFMANKAGFNIIEISNIILTKEIDIYIKKPEKKLEMNTIKEKLREKLRSITVGYNRITIWGAGAKSFKYAALLDKDTNIEYVIDSSPSKVGQYIGGINKAITKPTQDIVNESEIIIIFASAYNDDIIRILREKFGYRGGIVYFEGFEVCRSDCRIN